MGTNVYLNVLRIQRRAFQINKNSNHTHFIMMLIIEGNGLIFSILFIIKTAKTSIKTRDILIGLIIMIIIITITIVLRQVLGPDTTQIQPNSHHFTINTLVREKLAQGGGAHARHTHRLVLDGGAGDAQV